MRIRSHVKMNTPVGNAGNPNKSKPVYQWDLEGNLIRKFPTTSICAKMLGLTVLCVRSRILDGNEIDGFVLTRDSKPPKK